MKLRPYQEKAISGARKAFVGDKVGGVDPVRAVIDTLPTGTGKSLIFLAVAGGVASKGRRVLLLVEGVKLVKQAAAHFRKAGYTVGIEMAEETAVAEHGLTDVQKAILERLPSEGEGEFLKGPAVLSASILCERGLARKVKQAERSAGGWYVRLRPELPQIVVASVDTMINRLDLYAPDTFRMVIVDECFPAGTLIDGRPIETIQVGDLVRSYNEAMGEIELRPVKHVFKREPSCLVRLYLSNGSSIVCTPAHPFAVDRGAGVEYLPALAMRGHVVLRGAYSPPGVRCVRDGLHPAQFADADPDLLPGVSSRPPERPGESGRRSVPGVREDGQDEGPALADSGAAGAHLLLGGVREGADGAPTFGDDGPYESQVRIGADEAPQPDGEGRGSASPDGGHEGDRVATEGARGQRENDRTAAGAGGVGLADGGRGEDGGPCCRPSGSANALQDRHRTRGDEDRRGGGRRVAPHAVGEGAGRPQDGISPGPRVDRVEVLELAGSQGPDGVCPDGHVYNLEVEHNHNYFVDDILVHNCHHAVAPCYLQVFEHFGISVPKNDPKDDADLVKSPWRGDTLLFGLTATPDRGDKRDLMRLFETVGFEYDIRSAISDGWLVPIRQEFCHLDGLDLRKVRKSAGDLDPRQLCELLEPLMVPICDAIVKTAGDMPTLVYSPLVNLAKSATLRLQTVAPNKRIETITGETPDDVREDLFQGIDRGDVWALSSVGTLTEGVDLPRARVAVMLRLTMSRLLYAQILGRVLRPAPEIAEALNECKTAEERKALIASSSKPYAIILDFAGNACKHKLVRAIDILADQDDPALQMAENIIDKENGIDPLEALARAQAELAKMLAQAKGKAIQRMLIDPFELLDVTQKTDSWGRPATDKQITSLLNAGVVKYDPSDPKSAEEARAKLRKMFDMTSASVMLEEWVRRIDEGLASPAQVRTLVKFGMPPTVARALAFEHASSAIDQLKVLGWKATPGWIEQWQRTADAYASGRASQRAA